MFKYIFFDLDGTLTDSAEGITKCVQYALESRGINVPDLNTLRPFIGPPLIESFMKFYGMTEETKYTPACRKCLPGLKQTALHWPLPPVSPWNLPAA